MKDRSRRDPIRKHYCLWLVLPVAALASLSILFAASPAIDHATAGNFTPLVFLDKLSVIAHSPAHPGPNGVENILKEPSASGRHTEYASDREAENTFIDFDLGRSEGLAAYKHIQRRGPDTVVAADLVLSDNSDFSNVLATVKIKH